MREGQTQEQHRESSQLSKIGPVQNKHCTSDTGVIYCDGRNKTENKHLVYSWSGVYLSVTVVTKSSSDAKRFQISNWAAALLRLQVSWFTYFSLVIHNKPLLLVCSEKKKKISNTLCPPIMTPGYLIHKKIIK